MKAFMIACFALLTAPALAQQTAPEIAFDSVPDFPKLPQGMNFGEVPGVAVNSKGHMFVFTRSNSATGSAYAPAAAQLLEFDANGEFVREVGKGLYAWAFAHSVRVDKDDNIWAIDKGSDMIVKFNPAGRVVWVFGRRKESADAESKPWEHVTPPLPPIDGVFRQPTDVAWDSQGNIYISDGYINSRVAKYSKDGDWVKSWGEPGTGPGQFRTVMFSVDVPPAPGTKAVYGNTPAGDRLTQVIGAPNSLCITPGPNQVMFLGESTFPGRVFKLTLDGKVLGVIGRSGRNLKQFSGAHALACPSENEIYVAETANWRVQKVLLHSRTQ